MKFDEEGLINSLKGVLYAVHYFNIRGLIHSGINPKYIYQTNNREWILSRNL